MAERTFTVDLDPGLPHPALDAAMVQGAELVRATWMRIIRDEGIVDEGGYLAALEDQGSLQWPYMGDASASAVVNLSPQADWIENGRAGFHLPAHWKKWKVGKDGNRYAVVKMRIPTPFAGAGVSHAAGFAPRRVSANGGVSASRSRLGAAMPPEVYARAQRLESGERLSGFGDEYKQSKSYDLYRELFGELPSELDGVRGYTWVASQFEGMVRTTSATPGGGRHTEYSTFRTITPESPGWFIPPTPARRVAERALDEAAPAIEQMLAEAAMADALASLFPEGQ